MASWWKIGTPLTGAIVFGWAIFNSVLDKAGKVAYLDALGLEVKPGGVADHALTFIHGLPIQWWSGLFAVFVLVWSLNSFCSEQLPIWADALEAVAVRGRLGPIYFDDQVRLIARKLRRYARRAESSGNFTSERWLVLNGHYKVIRDHLAKYVSSDDPTWKAMILATMPVGTRAAKITNCLEVLVQQVPKGSLAIPLPTRKELANERQRRDEERAEATRRFQAFRGGNFDGQ